MTVSKRALRGFLSKCEADMKEVTGEGDERTFKGNGRTLQKVVVVDGDGDGASVWRSIEVEVVVPMQPGEMAGAVLGTIAQSGVI